MNLNIVAYKEREENRKHIKAFNRQGFRVFEIDTKHITFMNKPWNSLMNSERRKFENQIFLENTDSLLKFIYH